ncbi:MAG: DUF4382 domain-containing protein [Steroidobacteraceae bacterium]|nr:DUF4382 domain-containing protein [Steroidobacteraceae bacterium]
MRSITRTVLVAGLAFGAISMGGCGGGEGAAVGPSSGTLDLRITDAPIDAAAEVVVVFTGIELHSASGGDVRIDFPNPRSIDLLKLQDGATDALTDGLPVPVGDYQWIRLIVNAEQNSQSSSYIKLLTGEQYPLWIPSGAESGLKLVRPFKVAQGGTTRLLIDFDLRKSIIAPPGQSPNYIMRPALRVLDELQTGKIEATVDLAALAAAQLGEGAPVGECAAGVYLFAGSAATPDDQDGDVADGADPIVYEPVAYDGANTTVTATIPFIEAGTYTLAATCDFDVDAADVNDYDAAAAQGEPGFETLRWTILDNVSVTANTTTAVTLP